MTAKAQIRAKSAIERFNKQLESGKKTIKGGAKADLTEKDVKLINQVIKNTTNNILSSKKVVVNLD